MKKRLLYIIAFILLVGGIMGLLKNIVPSLEWFSFRYIINGDNSFKEDALPMYARIYGIIMALLEVITSVIILLWKKKYFMIGIITIIINCVGCLIAIIIGDLFAIVSLLLCLVPLYLLKVKYYHKG